MHFEVKNADLLPAVQALMGAVERKQALPILAHVCVKVFQERLSLLGTDLEISLSQTVPCQATGAPFATTLPARKLLDIARTFPQEAILSCTQDEQRMVIKSGKTRYVLGTLPAHEYPVFEEEKPYVVCDVASQSLAELMAKVSFAMAQQDVRYYLNGMLLAWRDGTLVAMATDGHRLARGVLYEEGPQGQGQIILPRKAVQELKKLAADKTGLVRLKIGSTMFFAEKGGKTLSAKIVEGQFPEYRQVLPRVATQEALLDREAFRTALGRVSVLLDDKGKGGTFLFQPGRLVLQVVNAQHEEVEEEMQILYDGPERKMAFNIAYIQEYLGLLDATQVVMETADPQASAIMRAPQDPEVQALKFAATYVVMPMRL